MVGTLAPLFNQSDVSLGVARREADALPEIFLRDMMGAEAGHEKPFRLQQLQIRGILSNQEIRATHRSKWQEGLTSLGEHS
jgi:hypothetical protein